MKKFMFMKFMNLLIVLHLSFAEVSIKTGKIAILTDNICYQDAKTQEFERLILSDNPVNQIEPDLFYKFTLEGTKESRYLLFKEGKFSIFKEDGSKVIPFHNSIRDEQCGPNNLLSRTFTPASEVPIKAEKTSNLVTPPSADVSSEKKYFYDKEFCFCFAWSILLILYKFYEQWTHNISSQNRSVEISKRADDNNAINENQNPRRPRKVPQRYLSR